MIALHRRRHPTDVPGCFGCKITGLQFGSVSEVTRRETQLAADLPAYKRLRRNGLQPESIAGAARLEATASTPNEVNHPRLAKAGLSDEAIAFATTPQSGNPLPQEST